MSSAAARGAAGWLHMKNRVIDMHFNDLQRERLIREKKEGAAPRVEGTAFAQARQIETPAARAPVVVYKRKRKVAIA